MTDVLPPVPSAESTRSTVVIALDVGGTGIKCALVRPDGTTHHAERHPTGADRGPEAVVETILSIAEGLADRARADGLTPAAVGIAVPGVVNEAAGVAVWSSNVGFRDVPLRDMVTARLGLPAALGHDVRAGAVAEARLGAGRGGAYVLFVAIGTGIAAGLTIDGTAFTGAHGAAGELGHIVVRPDGPKCGCGQTGCLEAVASAAAVGRRYTELADPPPTGERGDNARPTGERIGAAEVVRRAKAGEQLASRIWRETIDALADGLLTAQALYDPAVVVVGGGLAEAGDDLLVPLRSALHARLTFHREPRLVRAALGDEAGCLGAALLALDTVGAPASGGTLGTVHTP